MTIGITGHRPPGLGLDYKEKSFGILVDFSKEMLGIHYTDKAGEECIYLGMALGFDQAIATACIEMDIPFVACIPQPNQEKNWPDFTREKYYKLLDRASGKIFATLSEEYNPYWLQRRNEIIVSNSDWILALWNGTKSGTSDTLYYAIKNKKPIVNLWDNWLEWRK